MATTMASARLVPAGDFYTAAPSSAPARQLTPHARAKGTVTKGASRLGGAMLLGATSICTSAAVAHAASGGGASSGGAIARPAIDRVVCVTGCATRGRARAGATVRVRGSGLAPVTTITFAGRRGRGDDVELKVRARSDRALAVRVPAEAVAGPLLAGAGRTVVSLPSEPLHILAPPPPPPPSPGQPAGALTPVPGPREPGGPRIETVVNRSKAFFGARGGVAFSYRVADDGPVNVRVDLVRADGAVVHSWAPADSEPGPVRTVVWDGMVAWVLQPEGRYAFRLAARGTEGAMARSARAGDATQRDAFDFYQHIFPVRLKHSYGAEGAAFGSGRGRRGHQGHDVFARCGARLVAARGGVVKFKQYHAAAGHYIVIDGDQTGVDYAYMHLAAASPLRPGQRVQTGQEIGAVGDSGNADGCHLHFEMWSAPGWYDGGRPLDPLPRLRAWDAFS